MQFETLRRATVIRSSKAASQPDQSPTIETPKVSETLEFDMELTWSKEMLKSGVELGLFG
jgi:hypothetical protein